MSESYTKIPVTEQERLRSGKRLGGDGAGEGVGAGEGGGNMRGVRCSEREKANDCKEYIN